MSYLRPTCSDAAARVTNLGLSRYVPSIWQSDAQIESVANITSNALGKADELTERLPSQRPLDRRWDKSRGLVFGDRSHVLRTRTWTPARGIVFASNIGQRRGYASRRIAPTASVAPKLTNNEIPPAGYYNNTGLPHIERPADATGPAAPKGAKQQELEKNLKAREKDIKDQAHEIQELKAQLRDAQVQLIEEREALKNEKERINSKLIEEREALKNEKERIYSKGTADGQVKAKKDFEDDKKMFERQHEEMEEKLMKAEARYPELKRHLEEDIVRRETRLGEKKKLLEQAREKQKDWAAKERQLIEDEYSVANKFAAEVKRKAKEAKDELDERDRELTIKQNEIRTRRAQRSNYSSYQTIWRNVQTERKILDEKLRSIAIQLVRERNRLIDTLKRQDSDSNPPPAGQPQLTPEKLRELETGVDALRAELQGVDKELQILGHDSRSETRETRFNDTRLAANSMSAGLYIQSIRPLKSIKTRTQQEIDSVETEIQNASNATTREELKYQKEALNAEKIAVNTALELAHLDHKIQIFETLQHEPYVPKAVHLATFDLKTQSERIYAQSFNDDTQEFITPEHFNSVRNSLSVLSASAKKTALVLEMRGEHKEHEKRLDATIVEKLTLLQHQMQAKRAQLFGHHKSARVAAKRAPPRTVRAWGATSSSSTTTADSLASTAPASSAAQDVWRFRENQLEIAKLRQSIHDGTSSLDPEFRTGMLSRFYDLEIQQFNFQIKVLEQKLYVSPRKRSEVEHNQKCNHALHLLRSRRERAQAKRQKGIEPLPPKTGRQRLHQRNKASKSSESQGLDDLMTAWSADDGSVDDALKTPATELTVVSQASKVSTQDPTGLNMTPTPAKQATHQPTGRRDLHDHLLWTDFLRQQESREGRSLSSLITSPVNENEATCESRSGDVSVVPSADCATADAISDISTQAARDDDAAAKNDSQAPASLCPKTSFNDSTDTENTMAECDEDFVPTYEISANDKKNALIASRNSTASFWRYSLYKNAAGEMPKCHYCTNFEQTEAQVAKFLGEKVVGFDLEWEKFKSRPGEDSAKRCVSLMQIAAEGKVALFHLAVFKGGDSTEELIPQNLRAFLEDPKIIKVGVNIGGDATRLRNCFGIEMQGNIELSHLYKLVTYGESDPAKVNRGLYALANQVKEVLHLPLAKGAVRTSSWSKRLNGQQTEYAVSDAYAGLRLYYELERRRKAMVSKPPRPKFHELGMPILLGGGELPPTKGRRGKQPVDVPEEVIEEETALQEQEDGDASEDSEDVYDTPADIEAFDAYVESQDAHTVTGASLPEIKYPTLPSLEDLLSEGSDVNDDSSLPSDPITKNSVSHRTPNLHTPEAVTADSWATAWQAQLPATSTVRATQPQLRAYHLWHHQGFDLKEIPALLRKEPLALSTVVSYIAEVIQKEDIEFDVEKVRELRARLPASVRGRYAKLYAQ